MPVGNVSGLQYHLLTSVLWVDIPYREIMGRSRLVKADH
jgi:hypothetical protein